MHFTHHFLAQPTQVCFSPLYLYFESHASASIFFDTFFLLYQLDESSISALSLMQMLRIRFNHTEAHTFR